MNQDRMVQEFLELIAISSPSLGERQIADVVKAKLQELGCEVEEDGVAPHIGGTAGNIIARLKGDGRGEPLMLSAHLDRVPNGDGIRPVVQDGVITSDGSTILAADDLSGVVSILEGIRKLKESGKPHGDVEIVFTVCEEEHTQGSRNLDYGKLKAKCAYCLDSPGHTGRVIHSAPTIVELQIDVWGQPAHAGNAPEKGVNALKAAAQILATMEEGRLDFETTSNWSMMQAGNVTNVVCPHAKLTGEARSRDPEKVDAYIEYVRRHAAEVIAQTKATHEVRVEPNVIGFCVPEEDDMLATLCGVLRDMGIEPAVEKGGGGMDANWFNLHGIRGVGVATGYFKNHTTDEMLYVDDLHKAGEMVYRLILAFAAK